MRFKIAVQINIPTTRSSVNIDSVTDDGYVLMSSSRMMSIWPLAAGGWYLSVYIVLNLFVVHKIWSIWQIEEIEGQILTMLLLFFGNGKKLGLISVHLLKCWNQMIFIFKLRVLNKLIVNTFQLKF